MWGSATDGARVYAATVNYAKHPRTLLGNGSDAGKTIGYGFWSAVDAGTGEILWRFASGGSVNGDAAVADGVVYWGSGYGLWGGRSNNRFFAFEIH